MYINNGDINIKLFSTTFELGANDNKNYDRIVNPYELTNNNKYSTVEIDNGINCIVAIGKYFENGSNYNAVLNKKNELVVLLGNSILVFEPYSLELLQYKTIENLIEFVTSFIIDENDNYVIIDTINTKIILDQNFEKIN